MEYLWQGQLHVVLESKSESRMGMPPTVTHEEGGQKQPQPITSVSEASTGHRKLVLSHVFPSVLIS